MLGSVAMMLEMSFGMENEARNLWQAMQSVFTGGFTTADLSRGIGREKIINTAEFGDKVAEELSLLPES